jgi:hypothetical protein
VCSREEEEEKEAHPPPEVSPRKNSLLS